MVWVGGLRRWVEVDAPKSIGKLEKSGADEADEDQDDRQSGESRLAGGEDSGDAVPSVCLGDARRPFS